MIKRAQEQKCLPNSNVIQRHGLSEDELMCIVRAVVCGNDAPVLASIRNLVVEHTAT